jgi:adenylate cyclase class 2
MTYEVELKFPIDDVTDLESKLETLQADRGATVEQIDVYFNHPSRDFGETDEALRIRSVGTQNRITYKGPLIDAETKTRRETEIEVAAGAETRNQLSQLLTALGFREFRSVGKSRVPYRVPWEGRQLEIVVDDVHGLGRFVEIECLAEESDFDEVKASVLQLAERLGLQNSQRKSYLQLLVERDASVDQR